MWKVPLFELNYDDRERRAIDDVLDSRWITMGERTQEFESSFEKFLGNGSKATAVANGTAALHMVVLALEIGPGDEIIVPALTFIADVNVVRLAGAVPVLAECKSFAHWKKATGFDGQSTFVTTPKKRPEGLKTFIRPNRYDPDQIHLAVYNWDRKEAVPIDLNTFLQIGEQFKVVSVQNYFDKPVIGRIYEGKPVMLPMTQEPTGPEFGAFVVEKIPISLKIQSHF